MILHGDITINGKEYKKGSHISPWNVFPFFLIHILIFGASGFAMAYFSDTPIGFLYMHGGIAILVYLVFYRVIFGIDEVRWMLINAGLGIFGLYSEISMLLSLAGKTIHNFPLQVHVIPFMYYILYTFLIRQVIIELTDSRENETKLKMVGRIYMLGSVLIYGLLFLMNR
ncbi:hypothetical protein TDB9533_03463 [Thalassocella blandensis]|nr:hypothetical protein TDB9533_03463 [Thalassocella blandensis]